MRSDLPTGTVTFLFTDIEGSTQLLHELGDAYAGVLAEHHRVLREVWTRYGGIEVDTQGDAFFVAFARATDAVAAAAGAQGALSGSRVRVRMGLHTGEPQVGEVGYVGLDVHRAARIANVAHGGQVLLSQTTRDLVRADVLELGSHRLKDLTAPEALFQLGSLGFPPLRSLHRTNLPVQPNPLIGRAAELAELTALMRGGARLVTLTGAGGSGKTRLSLHAAAELATDYPDGVWFVALAPIEDASLVEPAIAQVIDARGPIVDALRTKRLLLVLDNFEHVLDGATVVADLLAAAPAVQVIATSRERLALSAEKEYLVPTLEQVAAVALFTERARRFVRDFEPNDDVGAIVTALDGLPLAIELAAARIKVLTPGQIRERLLRDLGLLSGGGRDLPERQRTLRATLEWSHRLLDADERGLFAQLGVFSGSFDLRAAEAVADAEALSLAALVDKSLVHRTTDGRFFLLATIRAFARERLDEADPDGALFGRHADDTLALAEAKAAKLRGPEQPRALLDLEAEQDNLRSALAWGLQGRGDALTAVRLAAALRWFWQLHSHLAEGETWLRAALAAAPDDDAALRAAVLQGLGQIAFYRKTPSRGEAELAEAVEQWRAAGDGRAAAEAMIYHGVALARTGDDRRGVALCRAAIAAAADDPWTTGFGCWALGAVLLILAPEDAGDGEAVALLQRSVELLRPTGDPWALGGSIHYLGMAAVGEGRWEEAWTMTEETIAIFRAMGDRWRLRLALRQCAEIAEALGRTDAAGDLWAEAEVIANEIGLAVPSP